jgi:hypothetical protein
MKKAWMLSLVMVVSIACESFASMIGMQTLELDFKDHQHIVTQVEWSNPDKLTLTSQGLGFEGESAQVRDIFLETIRPFAIGYSWRPAQSATIDIEIVPPQKMITLSNGQTAYPFMGNWYVRYSPDTRHWSSWQVIEGQNLPQKDGPWKFRGEISVPQKERAAYQQYLDAYYKLDVPWTSDEEAAVKWILQEDPNFFSQGIPFVGYLQFLYEGRLYGGQRIESIKIDVSYGVGGLATIPRDRKVEEGRSNIPWRFQIE